MTTLRQSTSDEEKPARQTSPAIPPGDQKSDYHFRGSVSTPSLKGDLTHRRLKSRHIQLIGIGGTIGTALYVRPSRPLTLSSASTYGT